MISPTDLSLIRRYVDDECSPEEATDLKGRLEREPVLREWLDFERKLRSAVRASIGHGTVPAGLRDQVISAIRDDEATPVASLAETRPPESRQSWFQRVLLANRANASMVAATLVLVAGAVLIGIFGPQIDDFQPTANHDIITDAALWASEEHGRCAGGDAEHDAKLIWQDGETASERLTSHLGRPIFVVEDLFGGLGYDFQGAGTCGLPGGQPSGHIVYARPTTPDRPGAMVSLFVVPDVGQFDAALPEGMEPGVWYESDGGPRCAHQILRCTDTRIVIFLVCCDTTDLPEVTEIVSRAALPVR